MLAEDGHLADFTFGPQRARVGGSPVFAVTEEVGRNIGDATMQRVPDGLAERVAVLRGVDFGGEQGVVEAGRDDQAGERAQPGEPVLVAVFVQCWVTKTSRGAPAERSTGVLGGADVHGAI